MTTGFALKQYDAYKKVLHIMYFTSRYISDIQVSEKPSQQKMQFRNACILFYYYLMASGPKSVFHSFNPRFYIPQGHYTYTSDRYMIFDQDSRYALV